MASPPTARAGLAERLVTIVPRPPTAPSTILLVEDDVALVRMVQELLADSGYRVWSAASGAEARALLGQQQPDLILLDLMLPDTDGLVLTPWFKTLSAAPIIILTARAEQVDRVLGLRLGAADFVAKPFDDEELLTRIERVLRSGRRRPRSAPRPQDRFQIGQLTLARGGGPALAGSRPVHLTPTEHRLLVALADHADHVVPRARLLQMVWGYDDPSAGHLLDVHLGRLRLKLARAQVQAPAIVTLRGRGYMLVAHPPPPGATDTARSGAAGRAAVATEQASRAGGRRG